MSDLALSLEWYSIEFGKIVCEVIAASSIEFIASLSFSWIEKRFVSIGVAYL